MKIIPAKKIFYFLMVSFAVFFLISPSVAQKKKKDSLADLPSGAVSGMKLLAMQKKGYINLVLVEPNPILYVEPLAWKGMTHRDKVKLGSLALDFINGLNKEQGQKYSYVFIKNMTTKEHLGTVHLEENRVEIFK